jgi:hypothetical protein
MSLLPQRLRAASTMFRILLSYVQCATPLLRMQNVMWPQIFISFMEGLEYASIDIFALVPVDCAINQRLGYQIELLITIGLPIVSTCVLFVLTMIVVTFVEDCSCLGQGCRAWCRSVVQRGEMWDLLLLLYLLEYPLVARKSLATFNCVQYVDGSSILADDTTIVCYDSSWWQLAALSAASILIFCFGLPLSTWLLARAGHRGAPIRRRLVQSLTWLYDDECWFMESVELLRKFLLTGVVFLAWPGSRAQLLFALFVCLAGLALHLRIKPFRDPVCDILQGIALCQLLITYILALYFYVDSEDIDANPGAGQRWAGTVITALNCAALAYVVRTGLSGVRRLLYEMGGVRLSWENGRLVDLHPPKFVGKLRHASRLVRVRSFSALHDPFYCAPSFDLTSASLSMRTEPCWQMATTCSCRTIRSPRPR